VDDDWLARQFEQHRPRLRAVATRLLGSSCSPSRSPTVSVVAIDLVADPTACATSR
jgi:DNA-directed RNA polymerase specialized sigma24 family protein